jgi:hypothetical protein
MGIIYYSKYLKLCNLCKITFLHHFNKMAILIHTGIQQTQETTYLLLAQLSDSKITPQIYILF